MYKMDWFYVNTNNGGDFASSFKSWLHNMGDIKIISHDVTVDLDGDNMVTVIYI